VRSFRTWAFKQIYAELPEHVQKQATAAYTLFETNPFHPSLHFKQVSNDIPPLYSIRIGIGYRALGLRVEDDLIIWKWIGSHTLYDKMLKML
jgi:hypothetical protein